MKKKKFLFTLIITISLVTLCACGVKGKSTEESQQVKAGNKEMKIQNAKELSKTDNTKVPNMETVPEETKKTDIPMIKLLKGIEGIKAETEAYADLEKLIIEYYEIPEEYLSSTTYYYNYVDFDEDGKNEIFAVVSGAYTSGTGGSSALWVIENGGQLHVNQDFTLINTPVIISDKITNKAHEIIVPYYGGGAESQYKILVYNEGYYTEINDAEGVKTLEGITGKAIIANDLIGEIENGIEGLKLNSN